jgi:hypothetical protein
MHSTLRTLVNSNRTMYVVKIILMGAKTILLVSYSPRNTKTVVNKEWSGMCRHGVVMCCRLISMSDVVRKLIFIHSFVYFIFPPWGTIPLQIVSTRLRTKSPVIRWIRFSFPGPGRINLGHLIQLIHSVQPGGT